MSVRADWVPTSKAKIHEPEKRPIGTESHLLVSYPAVLLGAGVVGYQYSGVPSN